MTTIQSLLEREGPVLGLYVQSTDPGMVEIAKWAGFDFLRLDNEHVLYDYGQLKELIRVAALLDMPCQVRVSCLDEITKLLDMGATGIVVPDVNTPERARAAVRAVKYHPVGARGMFPVPPPVGRYLRPSGRESFAEYLEVANDLVSLTVQIEDVAAEPCLEEIIAMEGVDMVASGKADLSQSLGMPGQMGAPEVMAFEQKIIDTALRCGKLPAVMAPDPAYIRARQTGGVRVFTCGPDEALVARLLAGYVAEMKG